jgi:hypothetical protein
MKTGANVVTANANNEAAIKVRSMSSPKREFTLGK